MGSKRRVFLVETMGGYCGYLASMAALASGADHSFIFEEPFTIKDVVDEAKHLKNKMKGDLKRGIVIRNECANKNYSTEFIEGLLKEEGQGVFSVRMNILGHMQQGGTPSPFDRNLGIKMGAKTLKYIVDLLESSGDGSFTESNTAVVCGILRNKMAFTAVHSLKENGTDFTYRIPLNQWWIKLRPLTGIMAKHEALYAPELDSDTSMCDSENESD